MYNLQFHFKQGKFYNKVNEWYFYFTSFSTTHVCYRNLWS